MYQYVCSRSLRGRKTASEILRVNPFDYLVALREHADELAAQPEDWMPWNYQANLKRLSAEAA